MIKKITAILITALMLITATGCNENYELQDTLVIEAIGIDYKDKEITVSVQALNTEDYPSSGSEAGGGKITAVHTVNGKTVDEALNKLVMITGKKPIYSHNRIVVFGKGIYNEQNIGNCLDFFTRSYDSRSQMLLAATEKDAEEIISVDSGEGILGAKILEEIILAGRKNGLGAYNCMYSYMNMFYNTCLCEYLPLVEIKENKAEEKKEIIINGTLITKNGKYKGKMNEKETTLFSLITENIDNGIYTVEYNNIPISLSIINCKNKIKAKVIDGKPSFSVMIKCLCDITELGKFKDGLTKKDIKEIEKTAAEELTQQISSFMNKTAIEDGNDMFQLNSKLLLNESKFFKENIEDSDNEIKSENWQNVLKNSNINYSVKVSVRRIGQSVIKNNTN